MKEYTWETTENGSELQETEPNEKSSIRQELSDEADNKPNKDLHSKEHNREEEPTSKGDTRKTADMSVVTFDIIVSEDTDENPTASNSFNQEEVRRESNPQETSHRAHIGNVGLKPKEGDDKNDIASILQQSP